MPDDTPRDGDFSRCRMAATAATLEDAEDEADLVLEATEYSTSATFDALNRPMTTTTADNSVHVSTYGRGGALRGSGVKHRGSSTETPVVSDIDYNARGQRVSAAFGNGTVQTTTYDSLTFRVRRMRTRRTSDGRDLQDLRYSYDPEGNPTEIRDFAQQRTFFNNDVVYPSRRYAYDALYRLIRAEGRETAFAPTSPWSTAPTPEQPLRTGSDPAAMRRYIEHFSLDANGSLLTLEHIVPSSSGASWTRTMTYATGSNRLASYQGTGGASVETPVHDELGRMTAMPGVDELDWDAEGRLRRTQAASGVAVETRYVYDGTGNRVRKARYEWVTDAWVKKTETIYVGGIDIERKFVAGEVEEEIETLHVSDAGRRIALVETRTIHEGEIVTTPTGKWRFQHEDHLRSSCVETNIDGVVISYEEYHAYGTTAYSAHTTALEERAKRYRYSGKERDEESGLYYYGARYLAPWIGRWISPDPAGTVDGLNLYAFVRGAPSRGWDADGRQGLMFQDAQQNRLAGEEPPDLGPSTIRNLFTGEPVPSREAWRRYLPPVAPPSGSADVPEDLVPLTDLLSPQVPEASREELAATGDPTLFEVRGWVEPSFYSRDNVNELARVYSPDLQDWSYASPTHVPGAEPAAINVDAALGIGSIARAGGTAIISRVAQSGFARNVATSMALSASDDLAVSAGRFALRGGDEATSAAAELLLARRTIVLGRYPGNKSLASGIGARYMDVPMPLWNQLRDPWEMNLRFLRNAIRRGDDIVLSTAPTEASPGTWYARELEYMSARGFSLSENQTYLRYPLGLR